MAIGHTRVMIIGRPAGQHWPMSSRYTLPSACALRAASKCFCASAVSLTVGGGGPNRHEFWQPAMSLNQVPVRSKGGAGPRLVQVRGRQRAERRRVGRRLCARP